MPFPLMPAPLPLSVAEAEEHMRRHTYFGYNGDTHQPCLAPNGEWSTQWCERRLKALKEADEAAYWSVRPTSVVRLHFEFDLEVTVGHEEGEEDHEIVGRAIDEHWGDWASWDSWPEHSV